ncbi:hypothetical protein ABKV19_027545 [Rosa sericea]
MVNDQKSNLMLQLVLLLSFTYVLLSASAPTTRSININKDDLQDHQNYLMDEVRQVALGTEVIDRRIGLETMDYSEVGPNPGHDPTTPPGRV